MIQFHYFHLFSSTRSLIIIMKCQEILWFPQFLVSLDAPKIFGIIGILSWSLDPISQVWYLQSEHPRLRKLRSQPRGMINCGLKPRERERLRSFSQLLTFSTIGLWVWRQNLKPPHTIIIIPIHTVLGGTGQLPICSFKPSQSLFEFHWFSRELWWYIPMTHDTDAWVEKIHEFSSSFSLKPNGFVSNTHET
jgi:hypothetical protein